jgi:hypothetical protein
MALAATEPVRGSFVAGEKTTVRGSRAAAFGLDGNTNVHDEEGKLKIFGNFEVTGEVTFADVLNQRKYEFSLTNAQLKALPTSFVELVAAPGANKLLVFHWCLLSITAGTTYTNVDTGLMRGPFVAYGDWDADCSSFASFWAGGTDAFLLSPLDLPINDSRYGQFFYPVAASGIGGGINKALKIGAWNDNGDYTGGTAGNSIVGVVAYSVFNITTGLIE